MLQTRILIDQAKDRLDDLHLEGAISQALYDKKTSPGVLLAALNAADLSICAEEKIRAEVGMYLPAGSRLIDLNPGAYPEWENLTSASGSSLLQTNPGSIDMLLHDESYLEVAELTGSTARLYTRYPPATVGSGTIVRLAAHDQLHETERFTDDTIAEVYGETHGTLRAWFDRAKRQIWLNRAFNEPRFLVAEAQIMPLQLSLPVDDDDCDEYVIRTPDYAEELLLDRMMTRLLPARIVQAEGLAKQEQMSRARTWDRRPGSGPRVVFPQGDYGFN